MCALIHRLHRPSWRAGAVLVAAPAAVAVALYMAVSGPGTAHSSIGDTAAESSNTTCQTTTSDGTTWVQVIGPAGVSYLPSSSVGGGGGVCPVINTNQDGSSLSCILAMDAENRAVEQQVNQDLFNQFMINYVQNNATAWAQTLSEKGYQGSAPSAQSSIVSSALGMVQGTITNSLTSAITSVVGNGKDISAVCQPGDAEPPQQGENDALAYAALDQNGDLDPWLQMAFNAAAQEVIDLAALAGAGS